MFAIENMADAVIDHRWTLWQIIFAVYEYSAFWSSHRCGRIFVRERCSGSASGSRRRSGDFVPCNQQGDRGSFRIWRQYSDYSYGKFCRILGHSLPAHGGVFYGSGIFSVYDDTPQIQQEVVVSICTVSDSSVYRRNDNWSILDKQVSGR